MKKKIRAVAIRNFHLKGYYGTGINDIAKGCGIQKSSIYHHYANKEDILLDIFTTTMAALEENLDQVLETAGGAEARLRAAIRGHIRYHMAHPKEVIIADSELRGLSAANYKKVIGLRDHYEGRFQELIRLGIDDGALAQGDAKILSYAMITLGTAVASWYKRRGRLTADQIVDMYERLIFNGVQGCGGKEGGGKEGEGKEGKGKEGGLKGGGSEPEGIKGEEAVDGG